MPILPELQLRLPFDSDETKRCTRCETEKPLAEFYVKVKKTGRRYSWCKVCFSEVGAVNRKIAYDANPEFYRAKSQAFRKANIEKVKERTRQYRRMNREKVRETERAYKQANPEKTKAKKARYRERRKHVIAAWNAKHYAANRKKMLDYHKRWRDAHPEHRATLSAAKHRRRARLAGNGGSHTPDEWEALKAFYDFTCLMCDRREPEIGLTKDHVAPISKGGTDDITNIQPLCKSCNSHKHARHIDLRAAL